MHTMKHEKLKPPSDEWNIFYWILATILLPVTIPWIVTKVIKRINEEKSKKYLPGKVVVITGASSGLGEALAHIFYKSGCKLILAARRIKELERVKNDLLALEKDTIAYPPIIMPLDLSVLNDIPVFVCKILNLHNHIDILINNGGISVRTDVLSSAMEVDVKVMLVNYFGSVSLTKNILPSMSERGSGHVVFISSVQGKIALPHRSSYSASKHAIQAFADSLRAEVADKGIKVLCVSPGYIQTQLSVNALTGSGKPYGKTDDTTKGGASSEEMAKSILTAILREEKDVTFCSLSAHIGMYLRFLFPSIYFWVMERKAITLNKAMEAAKENISVGNKKD